MLSPIKHAPEDVSISVEESTKNSDPKSKKFLFRFIIIGITVGIIFFSLPLPDGIVENNDGTYSISSERLAKKEKEKKKIDNYEVYRLTAVQDGTYICWNCPSGTLYLREGMVWRYGITSNEQRNYSKAQLAKWGVTYTPFHWGDLAECRKVEKDVIYGYPELPEYSIVVKLNKLHLIRPPGNKEDN